MGEPPIRLNLLADAGPVPCVCARCCSLQADKPIADFSPFTDYFEFADRVRASCLLRDVVDYRVDIDPAHSIIRLTVSARVVTPELAEDMYICLSRLGSDGGPYAAIYDLSEVTSTTLPTELVRGYARRTPSIPIVRTQVVVGKEPAIYGLARLFQICGQSVGSEFEVVHTLEEAYEIIGVRPEDFTRRVFPAESAA